MIVRDTFDDIIVIQESDQLFGAAGNIDEWMREGRVLRLLAQSSNIRDHLSSDDAGYVLVSMIFILFNQPVGEEILPRGIQISYNFV